MRPRRSLALPAVALLAWVLAGPAAAIPVVTDGGFEGLALGSFGPGSPTSLGVWLGDPANISAADQGITPFEGDQMLRFINTTFSGAGGSTSGEMFQLVDATGSIGETVRISAYVNRIAGDGSTDDQFFLQLLAFDGLPSAFPSTSFGAALASTPLAGLSSDADPATWERLSTDLLTIPSGTTYLAIYLVASENVFNDVSGLEFDGHYADGVVFTPEPASASLLLAGLVLLARRRS